MCGNNTVFFLLLCGMLFLLLGFLAWLASKDGSCGSRHKAQTKDAPTHYVTGELRPDGTSEAVPVYARCAKEVGSNG